MVMGQHGKYIKNEIGCFTWKYTKEVYSKWIGDVNVKAKTI